jgi:ADP-dependent NAD(P)H-hydrate dehydratase / NAD(P)H-hydrate epimerase
MSLPEKLYGAMQVKEFDTIAIEEFKIPAFELMNRAGLAAFEIIRLSWPLAKKFAVICGQGNNGGDGFVLAKLLHEDDFQVEVYSVGKMDAKLSDTAELARTDFLSTGLKIHPLPDRLAHVDVVVDALFGTGLRAPLKSECLQAINLINRTERPVLAIDLPSGIDGDSGAVIDTAVHADVTITYIGLKYALLTGPALNYSGAVVFNDLGLPQEVFAKRPWQGEILELNKSLRALPSR